jgi:hypothetical protein
MRVLGIDQVGPVHLNFVIVLSARESRSEDEGWKYQSEMSVTDRPIALTTSHEEDSQLQNDLIVADK